MGTALGMALLLRVAVERLMHKNEVERLALAGRRALAHDGTTNCGGGNGGAREGRGAGVR